VNTHCAWPTSARSSSGRKAGKAAARLAPQEVHGPRPLQEKASRSPFLHSGQRMRQQSRGFHSHVKGVSLLAGRRRDPFHRNDATQRGVAGGVTP